jgi:diacylglycerol kinase
MENAPHDARRRDGDQAVHADSYSPRDPNRERPSKRYTLTAFTDAYRLDHEEPTLEYQLPPSLMNQMPAPVTVPDPKILEELLLPVEAPLTRADRRGGTLGKSWAGLNGLKLAIRGDSSFFAHGYRFTIVLMFGVMIQLPPLAWIILSLCGGLILLSELFNSAIDALARSSAGLETLDDEHAQAARDIGSACVLVSVIIGAAVTLALFGMRLHELLME